MSESLEKDEKILEAGCFDMPFFHTPAGKKVVATIPIVIFYFVYIFAMVPLDKLIKGLIQFYTKPEVLICLAVLIIMPMLWKKFLRALAITDRRIIFLVKLPWMEKPKMESFSFDEITEIKQRKFIGIQDAKLKIKTSNRKSEIDLSEVSNLNEVVEIIREKKGHLLNEQPGRKTEKLEDKYQK